ncbi:MAG: phage portal protein, partial [Alicyclobacillus sp.]|nr:phage portal protein [Alicyclobacillus sp.]
MMGLLSKVVASSYPVSEWSEGLQRIFSGVSGPTTAGVQVDENTALRFITVYSCVRVLAEAFASLPLYVYQRQSDGGSRKATDHPVYALLHDAPNDQMTSYVWRVTSAGHQILSGNAYSVITFNGRGRPMDIYPVPWDMVEVYQDPETRKLTYQVWDRGKYETFPAERMLHIPGLSYNGIIGYSPIQMAREAIGMGIAASQFVARFYGQGMNVGGVLEHPGKLSPTARDHLRE